MDNLEASLAKIREAGKDKIPQESRELMHRATRELVDSGLHERAGGEGDAAPRFSLPNSEGDTVTLDGLLAGGPSVLTFFRGDW